MNPVLTHNANIMTERERSRDYFQVLNVMRLFLWFQLSLCFHYAGLAGYDNRFSFIDKHFFLHKLQKSRPRGRLIDVLSPTFLQEK